MKTHVLPWMILIMSAFGSLPGTAWLELADPPKHAFESSLSYSGLTTALSFTGPRVPHDLSRPLLSFATAAWEPNGESATYKKGKKALNDQRWQDAVALFQKVADNKEDTADAALYWKAHALYRLQRRTEALAVLADLRGKFPQSGWVEDGRALQAEIRQAAGQKISPDADANESLKMMALSGLMNADPEDAIPILQRFLESENSAELKKKALFVLGQQRSEKARALIHRIARGQVHPELQNQALRFLGIFSDEESIKTLQSIYGESQDAQVKRQILKSFMIAGAKSALLEIVEKESDTELRRGALRQLGLVNGFAELKRLYRLEKSLEGKQQVLDAMFLGGNRDFFFDLVRNEPDPKLRGIAIEKLGLFGSCDQLGELYGHLEAKELKLKVLNAMFISGGCDKLKEVALGDSDPELRKKAIHSMGLSGSKHQASLLDIYAEESQPEIKEAVLHALFLQGDPKPIMKLAKQEANPNLKEIAIKKLGLTGGCDQLSELYREGDSVDLRVKILDSMFLTGGCELLVEVAKQDREPRLRERAIRALGLSGKKYGPLLVEIYHSNAQDGGKKAVLNSLFIQGNVSALVAIAREEKDHQLKKEAIRKLSHMSGAEAKAFMLEILEQ